MVATILVCGKTGHFWDPKVNTNILQGQLSKVCMFKIPFSVIRCIHVYHIVKKNYIAGIFDFNGPVYGSIDFKNNQTYTGK